MSIHIADWQVYGGAWSTPELQAIFSEEAFFKGVLDILSILAESQAELYLIPAEVVPEIKRVCNLSLIDLSAVRRGYEETSHSMLGLIRELKRLAVGQAGEWVYYGATVQDITDTWTAMALLKVWAIVFRDLRQIENDLLALAEKHRLTPMSGRTHGQPGLPISFGFKVATWLAEIRRHIERLKEMKVRIGIGQLGGGVGSLSSFGQHGIALQEIFFSKLGLRAPTIAWISTRDIHYELIHCLAMIASTFDKIGHEVYTLQRPEIGEVREGFVSHTVGSITMPHKRNPEISEHLGTLARLIRHNAACLAENLVHDHERDGRAWKAEWGLIGPTCTMAGSLLSLAQAMCVNLQIDEARMLANLQGTKGFVLSENVMLYLAEKVGKQTAHDLVYAASMQAFETETDLYSVLAADDEIAAYISPDTLRSLLDYREQLGLCPEFVDRVARQVREKREADLPFLSHAT